MFVLDIILALCNVSRLALSVVVVQKWSFLSSFSLKEITLKEQNLDGAESVQYVFLLYSFDSVKKVFVIHIVFETFFYSFRRTDKMDSF